MDNVGCQWTSHSSQEEQEMRPFGVSMETAPRSGDFSSIPIRKSLPTCGWPMNQALEPRLLPHGAAIARDACWEDLRYSSRVPEAPIPPTHPGPRQEAGSWLRSHHPPSLISHREFFKNPPRPPSAASNPWLQRSRDFPGFLPRFIIEGSWGDFPNQ